MTNLLKIIVISSPNFKSSEARTVTRLLESGLEKFHLRKPDHSTDRIAHLLDEIPKEFHCKIIMHRAFELMKDYDLGGYHHSSSEKLRKTPTLRSRSLHKASELEVETDILDYVFLGPVFPSISKSGHKPKMSLPLLRNALSKLDSKAKRPLVYALGGIRKNKLSTIIEAGFDGVSLLGSVWGKPDPVRAFKEFVTSANHYDRSNYS